MALSAFSFRVPPPEAPSVREEEDGKQGGAPPPSSDTPVVAARGALAAFSFASPPPRSPARVASSSPPLPHALSSPLPPARHPPPPPPCLSRSNPDAEAEVLARAEPVRYGSPAMGEVPPSYPPSFGPDFAPPPHSDKPLQQLFSSPRDADIVFYELPHVYLIRGRAYDLSVTSLVKDFSEHFDAGLVIGRMRSSKREKWPRLKYALHPIPIRSAEDAPSDGMVLAVAGERTVVASPASDAHSLARELDEAEAEHGPLLLYSTPRGMTDDEIEADWEVNKVDAANRGTWIHWQLELWSNGLACHVDAELLRGLRFVGDVLAPLGVRCWATEKEVFGEAEEICGSVDWIGHFTDDENALVIVDWKRSKNLSTNLVSAYGKRMRRPLNHLDDCDGCKYALQLGCYAFLLEKYYGKTVRALALCCVHDHSVNTFVPYLRAEVAFLMRRRREEVAARLRVEMDDDVARLDAGTETAATEAAFSGGSPPAPRCALTGRLLYDGVRVMDEEGLGGPCNRKDAMVRYPNAELVDAVEETMHAQQRLSEVRCEPSEEEAALASCVPWRTLMPADGIGGYTPL